jgi:hypothetical protein
MAGLRGNTAWLMYQKQTAKGTPATVETTKAFKSPYSGGAIAPTREFDQLAETDANRDQGVSFVKVGGVSGNPEVYVRDKTIGAFLFYVLGADAVTGATNYVHTLTAANAIPYVTFWNDLGDTLFERHQDCFLSSLELKTTAGQPLTAQANILGLKSERLTSDPSTSPAIPLESGYVYNYNNATVTLGGGATALISSMDLTIDNNVTVQQTDGFLPYDVVVGQRQVSLSFDLIFETLAEYNKFHYGTESGTTISNQIYTTSADFQFDNGTNNQVKLTLPTIAYEEFPVSPDPSGAPIVASIRAVAQRPTSGSIITAVVKNQQASY